MVKLQLGPSFLSLFNMHSCWAAWSSTAILAAHDDHDDHNVCITCVMRFRTTLYVRNNLTTLHPVELNGHGGSSRLVFPDGILAPWTSALATHVVRMTHYRTSFNQVTKYSNFKLTLNESLAEFNASLAQHVSWCSGSCSPLLELTHPSSTT